MPTKFLHPVYGVVSVDEVRQFLQTEITNVRCVGDLYTAQELDRTLWLLEQLALEHEGNLQNQKLGRDRTPYFLVRNP